MKYFDIGVYCNTLSFSQLILRARALLRRLEHGRLGGHRGVVDRGRGTDGGRRRHALLFFANLFTEIVERLFL